MKDLEDPADRVKQWKSIAYKPIEIFWPVGRNQNASELIEFTRFCKWAHSYNWATYLAQHGLCCRSKDEAFDSR